MSNGPFDPVNEAATPLTPDERVGLKLTYVTTRRELNAAEQANIADAEQWAFARKRDVLTVPFITALHKRMFGKVWRWAGAYSQAVNRRIGSDGHMIEIDLHALIEQMRYWVEHRTFPPDELALRFHHRLTQIHPFPNGNGRHARMAADLLVRQLGGERFSWGGADLGAPKDVRQRYVAALRAADNHTIEPLLEFARS